MPALEITIINKLGLHARAAAKFVGVAGRYPCQVRVGRNPESTVDGKSIMAVMMLAAGKGTNLHLAAEGEQEDEALKALVELINNYFDEASDSPGLRSAQRRIQHHHQTEADDKPLGGLRRMAAPL